jgi:hypothetical protein
MEAHSLEHCCGVLDIGDFYDLRMSTQEELKKHLSDTILSACEDEIHYSEDETKRRTYNFFIATTNNEQLKMHVPLKELGFRGRKFISKQDGNPLFFWTRRGLPKELRARWNKCVTEYNKEKKRNDLW